MANVETTRTATHVFFIYTDHFGRATHPGFRAEYRPLNPKTGEPWQASRYIYDGADVEYPGYYRPVAYSTIELAQAAVAKQAAKLTKGRKA